MYLIESDQQPRRESQSGPASRSFSLTYEVMVTLRFDSGSTNKAVRAGAEKLAKALRRRTASEVIDIRHPIPFPPDPALQPGSRSNLTTTNHPMDTYTSLTVLGLSASAALVTAKALCSKVTVPLNFSCVHSRHGKFLGTLGAGPHRFFGRGHEFQVFDMRLQQLALQTQELITSEGISVKITAVGLFRITDPVLAISSTSDFHGTLYTLVQLALRDAVNGIEVERLLSSVRSLAPELLGLIKEKASGLGLELTELVVRDVIIPADVKSALSECWRSKKSALAELETARGKAAAARTLANAAKLYETNPSLLKIRYIEALEQASKGMGNTFVIGMSEEKALNTI